MECSQPRAIKQKMRDWLIEDISNKNLLKKTKYTIQVWRMEAKEVKGDLQLWEEKKNKQ